MKSKLILYFLMVALVSGCGGGGSSGPMVDNTLLSGDWSYSLVMSGNFGGTVYATVRGVATFNGNGTGSNTEIEKSVGALQTNNPFDYTVTTDRKVVLDQMVGTLSLDGNFMVASDTDSVNQDGILMLMIAVKQPTTAGNALLSGDFYKGTFTGAVDGINTAMTVSHSTFDGLVPGTLDQHEIAPVADGVMPSLGYETTADGETTFDDTPGVAGGTPTGEAGTVSIDGNLLVSSNSASPLDFAMSIKGSSKTEADVQGTYLLHQFADNQSGTGGSGFLTARTRVVLNGNGTGSFQELAKSTTPPNLTNGNFTYIVDTVNHLGTFFIVEGEGYGVISPDGSVIGVVNVDTDAAGTADTTVFIGVGVKQ